jgi:hypothetical protein
MPSDPTRGDAGGFGENVIPAVSDLAKLRYGLGEVAFCSAAYRVAVG